MPKDLHPVVAIIPARGGSKRIPRKNLVPLKGKPLVAYSIENAVLSQSVDRTIVSTDDPEIEAVARSFGAEVMRRPPDISGDRASSESALSHVLDTLDKREAYVPGLVVFLQATSPIRRTADIQRAIETLESEGADSLFSASPVEGFVWRQAKQKLAPVNYDPKRRPRRQDMHETLWEENGSIYLFKPSVIRRFESRLGGKIAIYPMRRLDSYQVDEPEDLMLMERLLSIDLTKGTSDQS